jgi:hypothetical protein
VYETRPSCQRFRFLTGLAALEAACVPRVRTRQGSYVRVVAVPGGGRQERGDAYTPDHNARVVLSGLGTFTPAPDPSDAHNELVAAAVADFLAQNEADLGEVRQQWLRRPPAPSELALLS